MDINTAQNPEVYTRGALPSSMGRLECGLDYSPRVRLPSDVSSIKLDRLLNETKEIPGSQPYRPRFVNSYEHTSFDTRDIPGAQPRGLIPSAGKASGNRPFYSLETRDVPGALPNIPRVSSRVVNPVDPQYTLPGYEPLPPEPEKGMYTGYASGTISITKNDIKYDRQLSNDDIDGSKPAPCCRRSEMKDPNDCSDIARGFEPRAPIVRKYDYCLNVSDINGRKKTIADLRSEAGVASCDDTGKHPSWDLSDVTREHLPRVQRLRQLRDYVNNGNFDLRTDDVPGAKVATLPENKKREFVRNLTYCGDIPGAAAGSALPQAKLRKLREKLQNQLPQPDGSDSNQEHNSNSISYKASGSEKAQPQSIKGMCTSSGSTADVDKDVYGIETPETSAVPKIVSAKDVNAGHSTKQAVLSLSENDERMKNEFLHVVESNYYVKAPKLFRERIEGNKAVCCEPEPQTIEIGLMGIEDRFPDPKIRPAAGTDSGGSVIAKAHQTLNFLPGPSPKTILEHSKSGFKKSTYTHELGNWSKGTSADDMAEKEFIKNCCNEWSATLARGESVKLANIGVTSAIPVNTVAQLKETLGYNGYTAKNKNIVDGGNRTVSQRLASRTPKSHTLHMMEASKRALDATKTSEVDYVRSLK